MSDPLATDAGASAREALDRHAKIEDLLLSGLDHYFRGEYDQAIHVWTRVLFLDRGHTRVRAYIERARSAMAERQRECEELLHRGVAAFDRGDVDTARSLLTSAIARGGPHDVALTLLDRINRLDGTARSDARPPVRRRIRRPRLRAPASDPNAVIRAARWLWLGIAILAVGFATLLLLVMEPGALPPWGDKTAAAGAVLPEEPLPIVSPAEAAFGRARLLVARGHLHEALRVLERVRPGDPRRGDADALRAQVQRAILTGSAAPISTVSAAPLR